MLGRLLYHTAQCVPMQTKPLETTQARCEARSLELHHARQVLGIVASSKGRKMMPMARHAAVVASMALASRREQDEALRILGDGGSRSGGACTRAVEARLMQAWGWGGVSGAEGGRDVKGGLELGIEAPVEGSGEAQSPPPWRQPWPWSQLEEQSWPAASPLGSAGFNQANQPYKTWYLAERVDG